VDCFSTPASTFKHPLLDLYRVLLELVRLHFQIPILFKRPRIEQRTARYFTRVEGEVSDFWQFIVEKI
jgi:hypothetical protein